MIVQSNQAGRMEYNQYLQTLPAEKQKIIENVVQSVGCVFTEDGQVNGSALLIHKNLILVPKSSFPLAAGHIFFKGLDRFIRATTFLDGENDAPSSFRSNFKLLFIVDQELTPAPLSVEFPMGEGVQFNYHIDGKLYALFYNTLEEASKYAVNSDAADGITIHGDAGGARYSWSYKGVTSLRQDEGASLTINQVYHVVEAIFASAKNDIVKKNAAFALEALQKSIVDMGMLEVDEMPRYLPPDQVIPGKYGLFQAREVSRENDRLVLKATREKIISYLESVSKSPRKSNNFFETILGTEKMIFFIRNKKKEIARIDIQSLFTDAAAILIRVRGKMLLTIQVQDAIVLWASNDPDRIAAVVHYIVHQCWVGLRAIESNNFTIVRRISLRE